MEFHFRFSPIIPYYVLVLVGEKKVSMQSLESPTGHLQFLSNPPFANGWSQYAAWWAWNNSPPEPGHSLQKPPNRAIAVTSSKLSPQIGGPLSLCCLWKLNRTDKRCTLVAEGPSQANVHWHFWAKSRPCEIDELRKQNGGAHGDVGKFSVPWWSLLVTQGGNGFTNRQLRVL